jgi:formylglycine-generating enzyme required for sulfatase activity
MTSPKHPAVGVSFLDVEAYLKWAGKVPPAEAQWELAARGPKSTRFPWGDDPGLLPKGRKHRVIEPILQHLADRSPFAVFDLSGNAAEWCRDWYLDDAYSTTSNKDPVVFGDPPTFEKARTIRGGSPDWTVTWRGSMGESESAPWLGFRGVLNLQSTDAPSQRVDRSPRSGRSPAVDRPATPIRPTPTKPAKSAEKPRPSEDPVRDKPRSSSRKPDRR